jgi:predicted O-methyltransferase YrrM
MDEHEYILSFLTFDNDQLAAIEKQYETREELVPAIGPEVGKLLGLILRTINAKRVLDIGTCVGYSTIWLAEAMRATGGKVTAIEVSEIFYNEACANVEKAGLSEYVEMIHGDAAEVVNQLEGPFDLILQDSAKPLYPILLNKTIELVRLNGIIAADDALFLPMGYEKPNAEAIHKYNIMVFNEPRLYSTILPIGDGLTLSVKLRD